MISRLLLLSALTTLAMAVPHASRFGCKTEDPSAQVKAVAQKMHTQESSGLMVTNATIEVDAYFHVVSKGSAITDGNVPDSQLQAQLEYMNDRYAPHGIHFNLKGTDRTVNARWAEAGDEMVMKETLRKGSYAAVNIYFLHSLGDAFGHCYLPTSIGAGSIDFIKDGCLILYSTVPGGSCAKYNLGGTVVHEVGHWFGLFHTFEGGCTGAGDSISDTPAQAGPSFGCPANRDSCPSAAGVDPIHNYMDYSDDSCYAEFTAGQQRRMHNMWNTYRKGK